jgi:hypothetical protein
MGPESRRCLSSCSWRRPRHPPKQIILDLDATDDPLHGHQEGRFFHGYYDGYCYLPLYIYCGRHLLAAKLRRADIDAAAGAVEEAARITAQIRGRWPQVRVVLRADSGFAREALMSWCEANGVDFLFGLAKNDRLIAKIAAELAEAEEDGKATGQPARRFQEFPWSTRDSWSRQRRVIAKAEWTAGAANPRFVVTSLTREDAEPRRLYEEIYCARGDMENRIKECQLDLFADRTPCSGQGQALGGDDARQPAAPVVRLDGLRAAVRAAAHRPQAHPIRHSDLRHDPPQAPQDRRPGAHQLPAHQIRHGLGLALSARICRCSRPTDQRRRVLTKPDQPAIIPKPGGAAAGMPGRTRTGCDPSSPQPTRVVAAIAP